ncbi:ABC transporter permease [Borreliella lusitaniae]|uniref:ABC transporter permease n=1 Tax=Borreliella lusitaniae TaxID=100177 RepID=UPI0029310CAE|nr:ABC transporter permease [Borreliella lusitaniae]WNY67075.1 ABC transporter permease [Borreliella lusitaniae]
MKIFFLKNIVYLLINLICASFFCVSLVNFFSNEQHHTPFIKTNILKNYLQYIGIYKSIERYTLIHDFNPKSTKLGKNCFLKHIAGNSYIIYKTKNQGILWGDYRYSLLSKGKPTTKIIFNKLFNTLKISIPGALLSYIIAIVFIIIWKIYIKNNLLNNFLEYLMILLHSMPRNLTVFLILSLIYYLNLNPKNLIMGGFAWFFSFFIFNSVIFKQALDKTLSEFYIKAAQSRGINKLQIILKHGLIASITPLITNMRPILTTAFFGASMIESMFEIDGIGALYLNALKFNDYAISKDLIFIGVFIMLIPNIITDILIYKINPYKDILN